MNPDNVPIELLKQASDYVEKLTPDLYIGYAPAWHGWAIRDAFIAGYHAASKESCQSGI